jgi:hypothetical protein
MSILNEYEFFIGTVVMEKVEGYNIFDAYYKYWVGHNGHGDILDIKKYFENSIFNIVEVA